MKLLHALPADDGFSMPAEFSPHRGCILIWPERKDSWAGGGYAARKAFTEVITAIARSEKVTVLASFEQYENARASLPPKIRVVEMSTDDAWARDITPTFVKNKEGVLRGIDWGFNAWGGLVDGLYFPWDRDNKAARKICDLMEIDCYDQRSFILEGGSIHSDGEGTLMVTESCLLSGGRNPKMSKEEITEHLCKTLGVKKVLWLPYGIYQDETNEHVDNICAFTSPGEVVLGWTDDESDPQYPMSRADLEYLSHETDAKGRPIKVHKLPLPSPIYVTEEDCAALDPMDGEPTRVPGDRLAASYVNFYIANGAIVMPAFGDKNDQKAAEILQTLFPTREIVPIYARDILVGGGNIHCITGQVPE
ncbi:MAG: agmatine deiminase [Oscillospiraceae bacterium]|nr:agmatine deiminase [Oscillospiraceae bacterium]